MGSKDLEANREIVCSVEGGGAAGDGHGGDAGEVGGDRENVGEVILEWILGAGADFPGGGRCDGGKDRIHRFEGLLEVTSDQGADFLSAGVIGVVVTRGEHVGAKDNAAFHLGAEAELARLVVEIYDVGGVRGAIAVTNPVEAREVRGGLRWGDDIIGSHCVLRVWQGNGHDDRPEAFELFDAAIHVLPDAGMNALAEVFLGNPDPHTFHAEVDLRRVIGNRHVQRGAVLRIVPGDGLEDQRRVVHRAGERPNLIQGRGESDEAEAGNAAIGRFQAHDPAMRGGLADRAAGVGTERGEGSAIRYRSGGATRGAARNPVVVMRVAGDL